MAKNVADTCMFCGEAPCACNAPKKKAAPKRAAKKVEPAPPVQVEQPKPEPVVERKPAQPSMLTHRKALASSKKPISTGPVKPMAKAKQTTDKELGEFELTRVLRMFNHFGMLSEEDKKKHAARIRLPQVSPETKSILDRINRGGESDNGERVTEPPEGTGN